MADAYGILRGRTLADAYTENEKIDSERRSILCVVCGHSVDRLMKHRDDETMSWITEVRCHGKAEIHEGGMFAFRCEAAK
ncbi:hypothetical protein [Methylosinus sp. PW1]|uniref:hypothetical protein n=1 Tax=Methylosinus sp. PW1 TaxID=107636 RepID=UPI000559E04F|nr:hypothetical protein [Methylosinus sp. PW1]